MNNNKIYIKLFYAIQDKRILFKNKYLWKKVFHKQNLENYIKKYISGITNRLKITKMNLTQNEQIISWHILEYDIKGYQNIKLKTILIKSWIKNNNNNKWVVIVHGLNSHKFKSILFGLIYLRLGYNIIVFDQRNHGESSKSLTTMGEYEKEDLFYIINFLQKHENNNIYQINFHGWSMGTFVIMEYLKKYYKFNKNIGWVILDSTIANLTNLYRYYFLKLHFNYYEHYYAIRRYAIMQRGYDPHTLNPGEGLKKLSKIPILYILNTNDQTTPFIMGEEAFNNKRRTEKNKISKKIIFECDHVRGLHYDQTKYLNEIKNFIIKK